VKTSDLDDVYVIDGDGTGLTRLTKGWCGSVSDLGS
jgi:hypothetical protein